MMELMAEAFTIRCHECGEVITIFKDDLDVEISFYDHGENGMGDEAIYDIQHETECPECGNKIEIAITGNEYPVGAYDYDNAEIFGADFIEVPSMGMVYYQDEFDIDPNAVEATGIHDLIARISADRDLIYDVSPREFEEIVEQVLHDDGFDTRLTQPTRDGGRDIVATKTGINGKPVVFYIECKRYARTNKVSVDLVRALYGVQTADKINKACLVTSSYFTRDAVTFAEKQNVMIDLVDGDALHSMIVRSAEKYEQENTYHW
ncbi:MAG: restriction endonuclease [Oscillospiraceae bacterium]|nr:restriction endonuclease [Oscillospiraceae bacterium]